VGRAQAAALAARGARDGHERGVSSCSPWRSHGRPLLPPTQRRTSAAGGLRSHRFSSTFWAVSFLLLLFPAIRWWINVPQQPNVPLPMRTKRQRISFPRQGFGLSPTPSLSACLLPGAASAPVPRRRIRFCTPPRPCLSIAAPPPLPPALYPSLSALWPLCRLACYNLGQQDSSPLLRAPSLSVSAISTCATAQLKHVEMDFVEMQLKGGGASTNQQVCFGPRSVLFPWFRIF
jgi:hypothetical protein